MTLTHPILARSGAFGVVAALLLLAGCASVPPPTNLMARASNQLAAATQTKAATYAPVDLGIAKKRYQAAQAALSAKKYALATDYANEALADGRLAETRAQLAIVRRKVQAQSAENARARKQLLARPAVAATVAAPSTDQGGLPAQVVLPQPAAPAPSASVPASPAAGGGQ